MTASQALQRAGAVPSSRVAQHAAGVVASLRIVDESTVAHRGRERKHTAASNRFIKVFEGYPPVCGQAGQLFYDHHYTQPGSGRGSYRAIEDRLLRRTFVQWLSAANATREAWSDGWEYVDRAGDKVVLRKPGGRVRAAAVADFQPAPDGKSGRVRVPSGSDSMQPGWYHVRGADDHSVRPGDTVRLYFAVSRAGSPVLVDAVTRLFNESGLPFHLKVDSNPDGYRRADAGVLYVPRARWADMQAPLRAVRDAVWPYLRDVTPLFTKVLATGIGLAEEPANGGSFGTHCGALLGAALWDARDLPADDAAGRLAAVEAAFRRHGVPLDAPHMAQAAEDRYEVDWTSSVAATAREVRP